jgi:hypothetical protein
MNANKIIFGLVAVLLGSQCLVADEAEDVAKKLANPVAAMISVPLQLNYIDNMGLDDKGSQWRLNVQPVIPIEMNDEWNIITRTIVPLITQKNLPTGSGTQSGIGDISATAWFSPRATTENGWIWGVGPVFLIPTGSDVSAEKWGAGPTAIALKQEGQWTYGGLANHVWSTGGSGVNDISSTFMQPFMSYVTHDAVTMSLMTETTYDWESEQWSVPIYGMVSKVGKIGNQMISYGAGVSYWAESPDGGPEGWGARFVLTFVFAK